MSREERRVVARGTIRVDARRARAKLREHLLVDLTSYTLEVVRAALGLGASRLNVRWDADDVVLAFDGEPIAPERAARLLDFALAEPADDRAKALRTLALGVNAALGLGALYVDVVSSRNRVASRARFTPELASEDGEGEAKASRIELPPEAFPSGTYIHVRRPLGLSTLRRALVRDVPPELALLAESTHDAPLKIIVNGAPVVRAPRPPALLRVPLELPQTTSAFVEILPPGSRSTLELSERGVRLLDSAWVPLPGLEPRPGAEIPARLRVDALALPTNASRSALREDSALARELGRAASAGFELALQALAAAALGMGALPARTEVAAPPRALEEALGDVVHRVVLAAREGKLLAPEAVMLLELPLLPSPSGERIPARQFVSRRWAWTWRSKDALPAELAPWLKDVVSLQGRRAERILHGLELLDANDLVARAMGGAARRQRLLAHPASEPSVPRSAAELARERFRFDEGRWAGLHGEVALLAPIGAHAGPSRLRIYVEERLLEVIPVEPSFCPLSFDAALAWPGGLRPRFDYDAVERDQRLSEAVLAVSRVAIGCAAREASRLGKLGPNERAALAAVLRDAVAAWSVVPERLGYAPSEHPLHVDFPGLWRAAIYACSETGRHASLGELDVESQKTGALSVARNATGRAPDGRPVVVASTETVTAIAAALKRPLTSVPYDRGLALAKDFELRRSWVRARLVEERAQQALPSEGPTLWLELPEAIGAVTTGLESRLVEGHLGVSLRAREREAANVPLIAVLDDSRTVPSPEWNDVQWAPSRHLPPIAGELAEQLVAALEGDAAARARLGGAPRPDSDVSVSVFLLDVSASAERQLARKRKKKLEGAQRPKSEAMKRGGGTEPRSRELSGRIQKLWLVYVLDAEGQPELASIEQIRKSHGDSPPLLRAPPGFATLDWAPVLIRHERERQALLRCFANAAFATEDELATRRARAIAENRRAALLATPERELGNLWPMGAANDPKVYLPAETDASVQDGFEVVAALPRLGLTPADRWLRMSFERRPFAELTGLELGLPLVAAVDTRSYADVSSIEAREPTALARVRTRVTQAAVELAVELIRGGAERVLTDARVVELLRFSIGRAGGHAVIGGLTGAALAWPTIQGGEAPFAELARKQDELWFGVARYPEWRRRKDRRSDLDGPVLLLPPGAIQAGALGLLELLGARPLDVSEAASALQAQRGGAEPAPPILVGMPAHPSLRAKTSELGIESAQGEVELIDADRSDVILVLLGGVQSRHTLELGCPVRAVLRLEALDEATALAELGPVLEHAAERLVSRVLASGDELPELVARSARSLIVSRLGAGADLSDELTRARVFADSGGQRRCLGELVKQPRCRYTTLEPPFPARAEAALLLSASEAEALGKLVGLDLVDEELERLRRAAERRAARPREDLRLSTEQRALCVVTAEILTESSAGEVGVLSPAHGDLSGIELLVGRRPLCRVDDGLGWPLVAVVDDASIEPDPWFEKPAQQAQLDDARARIRQVARAALERMLPAPVTALASEWVDDVRLGGFLITGRLWLDSGFPALPAVRVRVATSTLTRALELERREPWLLGSLPIEGDLLVRSTEAATGHAALDNLNLLAELWPALAELGATAALGLERQARLAGPATPGLDAHAWNLALLGLDASPPPVEAIGGELIDPSRVRTEIALRGAIWASDGRGWVEGEVATAAPSFVLRDEGPLIHVLGQRTLPGTLRRMGGVVPAVHPVGPARTALEGPAPVPLVPPPLETPKPARGGIVAALTRLFGGEKAHVYGHSGSSDPMRAALAPVHAALAELALAGNPVEVVVGTAGDSLRYVPDERRLEVTAELGVKELCRRGQQDRAALAPLTAAAVSEVNRALVEVTDAEERRALVSLLANLG